MTIATFVQINVIHSEYLKYINDFTNESIAELTVEELRINDQPEFKRLLGVYHGLIGNYTSGEYHPYSTTAQFLVEGFRIYSLGLDR